MKILVACEESQRVCTALREREREYEVYSCDVLECSGGHPEWHIQGDVIPLLNGDCEFTTMDGTTHKIVGQWDMIIAFPPCTHLAVSGARHFEKKRADGRQREGIEFFCKFFEAKCDKVSIENPVNIISGDYVGKWFPDLAEKYGLPRKPTQIIQPYYFGEPYKKTTCLWLKGLPELQPTNIVDVCDFRTYTIKRGKNKGKQATFSRWLVKGGTDRQKNRNKTFVGVSRAMAEQWI